MDIAFVRTSSLHPGRVWRAGRGMVKNLKNLKRKKKTSLASLARDKTNTIPSVLQDAKVWFIWEHDCLTLCHTPWCTQTLRSSWVGRDVSFAHCQWPWKWPSLPFLHLNCLKVSLLHRKTLSVLCVSPWTHRKHLQSIHSSTHTGLRLCFTLFPSSLAF